MGSDTRTARLFCRKVQSHCAIGPSYASIAKVLSKHGWDGLSMEEIARLASRVYAHGTDEVPDSLPSEPSPTDVVDTVQLQPELTRSEDDFRATLSRESPILAGVHENSEIRSIQEALAESIFQHVLRNFVAESIEGKVIGFTGDGPYQQSDLESLATKLGATPDQFDRAYTELDWVIIGKADYDVDYLDEAVKTGDIQFFTQEEFIGVILFGEESLAKIAIRKDTKEHDGIRLVEDLIVYSKVESVKTSMKGAIQTVCQAEDKPVRTETACIPGKTVTTSKTSPGAPTNKPIEVQSKRFINVDSSASAEALLRWPTFDSDAPRHELDEANGWSEESALRMLGYTVAKGVSLRRRQSALESGVRTLGLRRVVGHLAWLIRLHSKNSRRQSAVSNWEHDLDWLKSRYGST